MMSLVRKVSIFCLAGVFLLVQYGCATDSAALPGEIRAQLGRIAVVSAQYTPEPDFEGPGTGFIEHTSGAWKGLKSGAKEGAAKGMELGTEYHPGGCPPNLIGLAACPLFMLLGLAVGVTLGATVGTVAGGVGGMTKGMIHLEDANSFDEHKIVRKTLDSYLQKLGMQERLRNEVTYFAKQKTSHTIIELEEEGPTRPGSILGYQRLKKENFDTVLEVTVLSLGLKSTSAFNPEFSVFIVGKADLRRVEDDALLYRTTLTHTSQPQPYEEWAGENVYAFQRALNDGYRSLAEQIVVKLL
ncbi:MAG: hypothetical protein OEZ57_05660 [Nitrospirota bacterium]|nr:hypothetical protein [Nitrospirota bacterium]MDH5588376.1 hypothetical protein [Nitrospirota bacterium]MDH5774386.1 hypothetical protein [Nitrospirota bacterium]